MLLKLTIYKKYFEQILKKEKTIEYRDIKPFWDKKFAKNNYKEILFVNGYGKQRPYIKVTIKQIIKTSKYYELHLGDILEVGDLWAKEEK